MLDTQIVGSLPKPPWLAEPGQLRAAWRLSGDALRQAQDDAVRLAILEQEEAGLGVVTDGELRRRHYIWGFLDGLTGIDQERMARKQTRGGRYAEAMDVPRVVGEVTRPVPVFIEACRAARALTTRRLKVTLPGPMTMADDVADQFYGTGGSAGAAPALPLAMRFAELLNAEARDLVEAGADVIQFDEPCFNVYVDQVEQWGLEALERCLDGIRATTAVHICYGYGTPLVMAWKSKNADWGQYGVTLPLLAKSRVDQVSVECAASGVDPAVLATLAGKDVLVGVVDVCTEEVETPQTIADRIRRVLPYVPADRLKPCTDCGLVPRSREAARGKMRALAAGAELVRSELATGPTDTAGIAANRPKNVLFP